MATSKLKTQNVVVSLSLTLTLVLVLLTSKANSAETVSFSWNKFVPKQPNMILQGDAIVTSSGKLQLNKVDENGTPKPSSLGRALYSTPIHIWDKETGSVASFAASFNFTFYAPDTKRLADGLAFFLAPIDTKPQTHAGYLGLFNENESGDQVVAVEFDTFWNSWDPPNPHIGINVNSIRSIKKTSWLGIWPTIK